MSGISQKVPFVDDEVLLLEGIKRQLRNELGISVAEGGTEALTLLAEQGPFAVVVSDYNMPGMDGIAFLNQVYQRYPHTVLVMLTGRAELDVAVNALHNAHISRFLNKPCPKEILLETLSDGLEQYRLRKSEQLLKQQLQEANQKLNQLNEHLEEKVEQRTEQLKDAMQHLKSANKNLKKQYIDSIRAFSRIIEMRPGIKSGQSKYIAEKALLVAHELGVNAEEKQNILCAGLLIQIGKMSLPDTLLAEPFYSMSPVDKQRYFKHAVEGEALLNGLTQLKSASVLIRHQYERYDGSGLPDHLAKQNIPLGSRILNVVGDYIAYLEGSMTGEEMTVSAATSQLMTQKGYCYDPDIVDACVKVLKDASVEEEVEVELPAVKKSWANSKLLNSSKNVTVDRPIVEISWMQLKPGMELESVYFEGKPYIKNCIVNQKIISNIAALREKTGKNPIIKIRMGAK